MKRTWPLIISIICIPCIGCSNITTMYDYDRDFDFSHLKQYNWMEIPADFPATEIVAQRITKA
ncbi:MAG: hypothetical protein ACYSOH_05105, partial [Planctomycetota bacterium]